MAQYADGFEPAKLKSLAGILTDQEVAKVDRLLREMGSKMPWPTPDPPDILRTDEREAMIFWAALRKALKPRVLLTDNFYEWSARAGLPWKRS